MPAQLLENKLKEARLAIIQLVQLMNRKPNGKREIESSELVQLMEMNPHSTTTMAITKRHWQTKELLMIVL